MAIQIIALIAIVIVATAISVEMISWRRGTRLISQAQKLYRVTAAIVLEILLIMIFAGKYITARYGAFFAISYWTGAMALAFLLVALALLDMRATLATYTENRKEIFGRLIGEEKHKE